MEIIDPTIKNEKAQDDLRQVHYIDLVSDSPRGISPDAVVIEFPRQYATLAIALANAASRAIDGKGKVRHADDKPFEHQPICNITRAIGIGHPLGQVQKKLLELPRIKRSRDKHNELLDIIIYTAVAALMESGQLK